MTADKLYDEDKIYKDQMVQAYYVVAQQFKNVIKRKSKPYRKDWWNR